MYTFLDVHAFYVFAYYTRSARVKKKPTDINDHDDDDEFEMNIEKNHTQ